MKVFVTGASGHVGSQIVIHLVARGHTVSGLARSQASADKITALGATPIVGDLTDRELLTANAKSHDAVIHAAMDHSGDFEAASILERETLDLFADAMEGTNKPLLMSSGMAFLPPGSDETTPSVPGQRRADTQIAVQAYTSRGINSITVRLAMNTHSPDSMHLFFKLMLDAEKELGYIPYYANSVWSGCAASDAGLLYVLAMENGEAAVVHAGAEFVPVKDIAEALAEKRGKKAGEAKPEDLEGRVVGWLPMLLGIKQDVSCKWTEETYNWHPRGQTVLEEIKAGDKAYFGEA